MSGYFQPHGSEQYRSDRDPDALVDSDPDGAYDYLNEEPPHYPWDDVQENYVPPEDEQRDFAEEKFNAQLGREE